MNIPFSPPYIDEDIIAKVTEVLRSGWITTGPVCQAFEDGLKAYTEADAVIAVNSWTAGAELVLRWFGIGPGDEVIVPAYTYAATAMAAYHTGATVKMVDVGEDRNIDPRKLAAALSSHTKAIIPVDVGGMPCDYPAILRVLERYQNEKGFTARTEEQRRLGRPLIVADAAHSIGGSVGEQRVGTLTDVTVFSFHAVKNITTAEGGAIALKLPSEFDAQALYRTMRTMTLHGQSKDAIDKLKSGGWRYDVAMHGMKCNLPDLNAALGVVQLQKYGELLDRRERVFDGYLELFRGMEGIGLPARRDGEKRSSAHLMPLRLLEHSPEQRDQLIDLLADRGVASNVHFIPLPALTYFRHQGFDLDDYPVCSRISDQTITLPIYSQLSMEEVEYVVDSFKWAYSRL